MSKAGSSNSTSSPGATRACISANTASVAPTVTVTCVCGSIVWDGVRHLQHSAGTHLSQRVNLPSQNAFVPLAQGVDKGHMASGAGILVVVFVDGALGSSLHESRCLPVREALTQVHCTSLLGQGGEFMPHCGGIKSGKAWRQLVAGRGVFSSHGGCCNKAWCGNWASQRTCTGSYLSSHTLEHGIEQ